jgi:hypothetical protein
MEIHYQTELHNYALLNLNEQEVEIINYIIDTHYNFKGELYERNGLYFLFNENKKLQVQDMIDYLEYALNNKHLKLIIRKQKIEKIKEGS